jgi:hypothetical protein
MREEEDEKRIQQSGMMEAGHAEQGGGQGRPTNGVEHVDEPSSTLSLFPPSACLPATEFPAPCTSSHAVLVPVMYLCRIRPCVARVSGVDDPATNPKKPKANKIIQNVKPAAFAHP